MAGNMFSRILKRAALVAVPLLLLCMPCRAQVDTDNVTYMGRAAIGADDYLTAIRYFNQVIEAKPFLNMPYYYRAYAKFCLDDFSGAEDDCTRAIERNPYIVEVYQLRGLCRIRSEKYAGAIEDYTRAIRELPDDEGIRYNRALCHLQLKQYDEAAADINEVIRRWPLVYRAYSVRAQICLEQKDTVAGLAWIDTLLVRNAAQPDAWAFKGRYALEKQNYALADSCLTQAIHYAPDNYVHYVSRALARHGLNRFGLAINDYDKTIEIIPQHFVAHYNRGLLRSLVGDNNRAIEDFDFVLEQEPDNTLAIYNRALLRQETGDYSGAIADYSRLIGEYPNFIYGYQKRAECRRKMGNVSGAISDETVVARAELDITYGKPSHRPTKKVRKRSEHSLDQYRQLVDDEENDSTGSHYGRLFAADLFGKVQNKKTEVRPLAPYELTLRPPVAEKGYRSVVFLSELAAFSRRVGDTEIVFATGTERKAAVLREEIFKKKFTAFNVSDSLLLESIISSDTYDYDTALELLDEVYAATTDASSHLLVEAQRAAVLYRRWQAELAVADKAADKTTWLTRALAANERARQLSPHTSALLYNAGCLHMALNDSDRAEASFTEAIELDARFAEAYYNRGVLRLLKGNKEAARADFSRAGELGLYRAYALLKQTR